MKKALLLIAIIFLLSGCFHQESSNDQNINQTLPIHTGTETEPEDLSLSQLETRTVDFASFSPIFKFSAILPDNFQVEYVPAIESINIYDINSSQSSNLEKSKIFIRYFKASSFLTLSTVNIFIQENTKVKGHDAVRYEIEKKSGVNNFSNQPSWRNQRHKLIDIRFSPESPTWFYVFSYSPDLDEQVFNSFIDSLIFHSDKESLNQPLENATSRITKKPFGIYITPEDSPISPERFTGYHNAIDYEILAGEENTSVLVSAVCGGELVQKRQADGYGGLAIQRCVIDNQPAVVYYGHINLESIRHQVNDYLVPGENFATLGQGFTLETDNERKHLHLGISKGNTVDIRGYVPNESELENWINFENF